MRGTGDRKTEVSRSEWAKRPFAARIATVVAMVTDGDGLDAADLITRYEDVLRGLIRRLLGDGWHAGTGVDLERLAEKRDTERGFRRGVVVPEDLLVYTEHRDLVKVVNKRWDQFAGVLGDKKRWTVYSERIAAMRNAPMHGRRLLPFERHLLAGMTGEIGNVVAQHRSSQGPDSQWYPVVESVTDSFGNEIVGMRKVGTRLTVGAIVSFRCIGRDPQDRRLIWTLRTLREAAVLDEAVGADVELTWTVRSADVSESTTLGIWMRSDGEFHRLGEIDETVFFDYPVSPPV
ncbi:hypothetical protein ACI78T_13155 [Blastococcus sp. SYSU D00922]